MGMVSREKRCCIIAVHCIEPCNEGVRGAKAGVVLGTEEVSGLEKDSRAGSADVREDGGGAFGLHVCGKLGKRVELEVGGKESGWVLFGRGGGHRSYCAVARGE